MVEGYRWLGEALGEALRALGAPDVRVVGAREAHGARRDAVAEACFGGLSPFEVLAGGRKVIGLSQIRRRSGALLQAGIATSFDARRLARLMGRDAAFAATLAERAGGLDEFLDTPFAERLVPAVEHAIEERGAARLLDE